MSTSSRGRPPASLRPDCSPRPERPNGLSRRQALGAAGATLAAFAATGFAGRAAAQERLAVTRVTGELVVITGGGGNIVALPTVDGLIVVDSGAAEYRDEVIARLGDLGGERVAAVFNTHWHPDQVGANEALGASGATIHAHEKTRQRLAAGYYVPAEDRYVAALPAAGLPVETVYEHGSARIGGQPVEYGYLIAAHTDGDIHVTFPVQNVIAIGDILSPNADPVFDWYGGGWLGGRVDALAALLEASNENTRFVPGRGPVVGRSEIEAEHATMLQLFDRMVEHLRLGQTPRDMLEAGVLDGLGREFADPYRLLYDLQKGFWAHHNKLMHDIV